MSDSNIADVYSLCFCNTQTSCGAGPSTQSGAPGVNVVIGSRLVLLAKRLQSLPHSVHSESVC